MVGVIAFEVVDVQCHQRVIHKALKKLARKINIKFAATVTPMCRWMKRCRAWWLICPDGRDSI